MTDFGRKAGLGDMLKSVYDPDVDGVIAVAQTEADMTKAVYDTDDDGKVDAVEEHADLHEDGGDDEVDVTGLVGTTPRATLGDATAGRVFRGTTLIISGGTNANTLKCRTADIWNGDTIAEQDNVAKDATTGHFKLDATGEYLTILNTGLTGNALFALCNLVSNSTAVEVQVSILKLADGLRVQMQGQSDGTRKDITTLIDSGSFYLYIVYITDA